MVLNGSPLRERDDDDDRKRQHPVSLAHQEQQPVDRRVPRGIKRHDPVDDRRRHGDGVDHNAGTADVFKSLDPLGRGGGGSRIAFEAQSVEPPCVEAPDGEAQQAHPDKGIGVQHGPLELEACACTSLIHPDFSAARDVGHRRPQIELLQRQRDHQPVDEDQRQRAAHGLQRPAAAQASGSDEPHAAAGLRLLGGDCALAEEALPVGRGGRRKRGAQIRMDQRGAGARNRIQAAHAEPRGIRLGAALACFAIWGFYTWRLNQLGLERDAASPATTPEWIKRLENISGPGIVILRHHHDRRRYLLGHVARSHLVLVGLRIAVPGRAGLPGAGALDHRRHFAVEGRAVQDYPAPDRAARPGQVHLRLRDAEHLPGLLAVPHHLVGESAGRDSLVPGPRSWAAGA